MLAAVLSGARPRIVAAADGVLVGFNRSNTYEATDFGAFNRDFQLAKDTGVTTRGLYTNSTFSRLLFIIQGSASDFSSFTTLTVNGVDYAFSSAATSTSGIYAQALWSGATPLSAGQKYDASLV